MEINLKPTYKQHLAWEKLLDEKTKYITFGGGAGGGKSWLGAEWLLINCYRYPGSKWFIGREELKRLMASSYVTFGKVCSHHGVPRSDWKLNGQYNYIEFKNGSRIDLLDLKMLPADPFYERYGSLEYTGGWIEEAGETNFLSFDVLKSRIGRHKNKDFNLKPKLFITCNPKKGWLYQSVYKPWKEKKLPEQYAFIQSLYKDNPYTADEYGEQLAEIRDVATRQRLQFGNWEYDDSPNTLIEYDAILDLFKNNVPEGEWYITADIARFGKDKSVIMVWNNLRVEAIFTYKKQSLAITTGKISTLANKYNVPFGNIIIDEDGIGGGVIDNLRGVQGFMANSSPLPNPNSKNRDNYKNLKAQCSFLLADKINGHEVAIRTEDEVVKKCIIEELEQIQVKELDKDNKFAIVAKDEVKMVLGRSPDYSDCLMMRMLAFFKKKKSGMKSFIPKFV